MLLAVITGSPKTGVEVIRECRQERTVLIQRGYPVHLANERYLECLDRG